jgi:hypothetical protein
MSEQEKKREAIKAALVEAKKSIKTGLRAGLSSFIGPEGGQRRVPPN